MEHIFDTLGLFITGIVFCLSVLRFGTVVAPNMVFLVLGIRNPLESSDQTTTENKEDKYEDTSDMPWSLSKMQEFHDALHLRFIKHQEYLVEGNIKKALSALEFFKQQFGIHIAEENEFIIPLFKKNAPDTEQYKQRIIHMYNGEHKKFMSMLQEVVDRLREMQMSFVTRKSADILYILQLETRFQAMMHRHDRREIRDLYRGAEHGLSEGELKAVWDQCYRRRQELGFRLGDQSTLSEPKIASLQQNWTVYKDRFQDNLVQVAQAAEKALPLSKMAAASTQGYTPGLAEAQFVDNVASHADKLDKQTIRTLRSHLPAEFAIDEGDELGGLFLHALEKSQDGGWSSNLKESWANLFNVVFTSQREDVTF